jgi:hemerythrin-like domain-containing protein
MYARRAGVKARTASHAPTLRLGTIARAGERPRRPPAPAYALERRWNGPVAAARAHTVSAYSDPMAMEAVEVLRAEHRWIGRMLDCLEGVLERARQTGRVEAEASAELLALFVHFADGLHQRREEGCLFPRLLTRARSVEERMALGRLCGDHERERQSLRELDERLLGAIYGSQSDLAGFLTQARAFVALHRAHLREEDAGLLPLAEELLEPQDDALLLAAYRELERTGPDPRLIGERVRDLVTRLGLAAGTATQL